MKNDKFLIDNGLEAWKMTVNLQKKIIDGDSSFIIKKEFVSFLYNSFELLTKQIMIDKNNHEILDIKYEEKVHKNFMEFYQSTSLNDFFKNLPEEDISKFHSIKFSKIVGNIKNYISEYLIKKCIEDKKIKDEIEKPLKLLNELRNNETHFYINNTFLKEEEFCILSNFMSQFYEIIKYYKLLPFLGRTTEGVRDFLPNKIMTSCSYRQFAKSNTNKKLIGYMVSLGKMQVCTDLCKDYEICNEIYNSSHQVKEQFGFDEFFRRFLVVKENGLIDVAKDSCIVEYTVDENMYNVEYYLEVKKKQ